MKALCWALLTTAAIATGAGCWAAWHYQSVVIAMVALHGCWVTYQAVRAVIEAHGMTCRRCKRWQQELTASGYCELCFWEEVK
jgi:hypothetical protein